MKSVPARVVLFVAALLLVPFLISYVYGLRSRPQLDFASFYFGARLAVREGLVPYDYPVLAAAAESVIGQRPYAYLYPPTSLLFFAPFTLLSYGWAMRLMLLLNAGLAVALVALLWAGLGEARRAPLGLALLVYAALYQPLAANMTTGQVNLAIVLLVWGAGMLVAREKSPLVVALLLGVAVAIKLYPALFLLYLLLKRQFRTLALTLGVLAVLAAAAGLLLPATLWPVWLTGLLSTAGYGTAAQGILSPADWENQSLHGFMARLFTGAPLVGEGLAYALSLLLVGAWGAVCWSRRAVVSASENNTATEWALGLVTMVLVSPLSWTPHLVYVLPAAVVALRAALLEERQPLGAVVVGGAALLLGWRIPLEPLAHLGHSPLLPWLVSAQCYALLALWGYLAARLKRGSG
jgi:alpha-1,2-mannosyltransferase